MYHIFFIHSSVDVDTEIVSPSLLLWIVLQETRKCVCLFEILVPCVLDKYPEWELLEPMVVLFLIV